jgi:hypothetical protein
MLGVVTIGASGGTIGRMDEGGMRLDRVDRTEKPDLRGPAPASSSEVGLGAGPRA